LFVLGLIGLNISKRANSQYFSPQRFPTRMKTMTDKKLLTPP
jgi:hypothetical protein